MENKSHLYEPVVNFRENRPQMQVKHTKHEELYEKVFFPGEETTYSEYALNTTTWD